MAKRCECGEGCDCAMDDKALLADGFEDAFIGFTILPDGDIPLAVYDRAKCIEILMTRDGMTLEDADEYFDFNVSGAYMGPGTPLFIHSCSLEEFGEITAGDD